MTFTKRPQALEVKRNWDVHRRGATCTKTRDRAATHDRDGSSTARPPSSEKLRSMLAIQIEKGSSLFSPHAPAAAATISKASIGFRTRHQVRTRAHPAWPKLGKDLATSHRPTPDLHPLIDRQNLEIPQNRHR